MKCRHFVGIRWIVCTIALFPAVFVRAGDWPQILGPHRNGIADMEKISTDWPSSGPPVVWKRDVGSGNAGVTVAKGKAILFHHITGDKDGDVVEAIDVTNGKTLWSTGFGNRCEGPFCTPLIHDDRVILVGNDGGMHCVAFDTGKELWSHALLKEFHAPPGYFGVGSTPVVEGDNVLMNVGGEKGAGIVAFALKDGSVVWKTGNELASYSSPIIVTRNGVRHAIFITRLNLVSLNPTTGEQRFTLPFGKRGPTVNAATPLAIDDHLLLTANYEIGAVWASFGDNGVHTIWENDDTLSSQYPTPAYYDGFLYGIHGRDDVGVAELRCIEPATGKVQWAEKDFGMATFILADKKLLIQKTDGELIIAEPNAKSFRKLNNAKVANTLTRALPALANGFYFVRDAKTLRCVDLRGGKTTTAP